MLCLSYDFWGMRRLFLPGSTNLMLRPPDIRPVELPEFGIDRKRKPGIVGHPAKIGGHTELVIDLAKKQPAACGIDLQALERILYRFCSNAAGLFNSLLQGINCVVRRHHPITGIAVNLSDFSSRLVAFHSSGRETATRRDINNERIA